MISTFFNRYCYQILINFNFEYLIILFIFTLYSVFCNSVVYYTNLSCYEKIFFSLTFFPLNKASSGLPIILLSSRGYRCWCRPGDSCICLLCVWYKSDGDYWLMRDGRRQRAWYIFLVILEMLLTTVQVGNFFTKLFFWKYVKYTYNHVNISNLFYILVSNKISAL